MYTIYFKGEILMIHFEADESFFSKDYDNIVGLKTSKTHTVLARLHIQDITVEILRNELRRFNPKRGFSTNVSPEGVEFEYHICVENMAIGHTQVAKVSEGECTVSRMITVMSRQLKPHYRMISIPCDKGRYYDVDKGFEALASSIIDKTSDMISVYQGKIELKSHGVVRMILLFEISKENWNNKELEDLIDDESIRFGDFIKRPF